MSTFPQEVDITKTPHFLFEVGSLMLTVFGGLFLLTAIVSVVGFVFEFSTQVWLLASVIFGLLAVFGVGMVVWSSKVRNERF